MILSKTIEEKDYELIQYEVNLLQDCHKELTGKGVRIDIGHHHRFWEYGMALKALYSWCDGIVKVKPSHNLLDVGAGLSLLGPTICWAEEIGITEVEPNTEYAKDRDICNSALLELNCPYYITWAGTQLSTFRQWHNTSNFYDAVFSISVMEHVAADHEFLRSLADMVKQDGLLFLTTDVMPRSGKGFHFDNLREHNYTVDDIKSKISYLESKGFSLLGESDLEYKGDQVFNYSFASIAMVKK